MRRNQPTYTYDELVQLRQEDIITDLDLIQMHPDSGLQEEFGSFCEAHGRGQDEASASDFLQMMEEALDYGDI